jgi:hypothetical protein
MVSLDILYSLLVTYMPQYALRSKWALELRCTLYSPLSHLRARSINTGEENGAYSHTCWSAV